jgi:prepilin-type N-terminal cleavage/methylation domain-containing protein
MASALLKSRREDEGMTSGTQRKQSGFTFFELLIVLSVVAIIATIAVPNVMVAVSNSRLRANMTSLSGVIQSTRMLAVKQNRTMTTRITADSGGISAFAKLATESSDPLDVRDMQVSMEAPIVKVDDLSDPGAPEAFDPAVLGFTPEIGEPSFNTRGLPCVYSGGSCTNHGFLYYFHDTRSGGATGWAAVTISPAGRIKKWYWTGTDWIS